MTLGRAARHAPRLQPRLQHQLRSRQVQHGGDFEQRHRSGILLAPFDRTHVRAIDVAAIGKFLLREISLDAKSADGISQGNKGGVVGVPG